MNPNLKKIDSVMLFSNGNIVAFDEHKNQFPELQTPPIMLWADKARELGWNPESVAVELQGGAKWVLFETEFGWNWEIKS